MEIFIGCVCCLFVLLLLKKKQLEKQGFVKITCGILMLKYILKYILQ